ncbi:MAG: cytochrome c biogenesis protein CcdA [Kiritimatiellia bacterium]
MKRFFALLVIPCMLLSSSYALNDDPFGVEVKWEQEQLSIAFSVPEKHYLYDRHLEVVADGAELLPLARPEPVTVYDAFMEENMDVFKQDFVLRFGVAGITNPDFSVTVRYMGCDDEICFMPQTRVFHPARTAGDADGRATLMPGAAVHADGTIFADFEMIGMDAGYRNVADFLAFIERVEAGEGMQRGRLEQLFDRYGIVLGIVFTLAFGFLLNLTPCVLPMIPINLAIIGAGSQAGSRARGFGLGAVYGAGISLVYGVLGVVVVLTGAQFGTLNANPWFNVGIAILFLLLALAMFDVFQIDFSRFQTVVGQNTNRGPVWTAFLFGGVAALLAGACVAPAVISVLVLSTGFYQAGHPQALLLPFVLGLGMALPWPFAGAGLSFLPKPGRWMEWVKRGFGVLILLAAVYYGHIGINLLRRTGGSAQAVDADGFWMHDPVGAVAKARETGQDLFVDFWATWCKNCLAMDRTTFQDEAVVQSLEPYVRLKFQAEDPSDPATKRVLDLFGVKGLPSYVILRSR